MTQINMHSSKKEIDNMTLEQALELINGQINLGHNKGDFKPRPHMVKALEIAAECIKKEILNRK